MNWSYIAGFFDGEGGFHIGFARSKKNEKAYLTPRVVVSFSSTNKETLDKIAEFMLSNGINCKNYCMLRKRDYGGIKRKTAYTIRISQPKDMSVFVQFIEPFLLEKKESCQIFRECLDFWEKVHEGRSRMLWAPEQLVEIDNFAKRLAPLHTKRKPITITLTS